MQAIRPLLELSDHKRPVGVFITVTLAVGLPLWCALWLDHFSAGVMASIGGLVTLYLRQTPLVHRMITVALATLGFCASFVLTLLLGDTPEGIAFALGTVAFCATFVSRYFAIPAPGNFFFILVACIASAMPFDLHVIAQRAGLLLFGCMGACVLALSYSLLQYLSGHTQAIHPAEPTEPRVVAIFLESVLIAAFIVISYSLAIGLGFDKPYWAPISCAAILQGASFRAVWHRNIHRIVGTCIGMGLAWLILSLHPAPWALAILIPALSFIIEVFVTRNYGLAVIFITPLTILLAEARSFSMDIDLVIRARLIDVFLGSLVGFAGGWLLHHRRMFDGLEKRILRIIQR